MTYEPIRVMETGTLDPGIWPVRPPAPENPHQFRRRMLQTDIVPMGHINKLIEQIEYYPEVQIAVLRKLNDTPSKGLLAAMATAVAEVIKTPGQSVTDADRLRSIEAVRKALEAAVEFTDPPTSSRGAPF